MQAACMLHEEDGAVNPKPARTQAERRATTRSALVSAARELFAARGYAGAGREEIVERAGVTRGAMYHHFASKEDLFRAVYEAVEAELCTALAEAAMASADPVEQLRLGAKAFLDAAGNPEVRRIVLLDAPAVLPLDVQRELAERYGLGLVREALHHADAAGRLRVGPVDVLAPVLLAALHEAATSAAGGADVTDLHEVVDGLIAAITTN
jgi:AcrR family transcriptional regulator